MSYLPAAVKNAMIAGGFPADTTLYWGFASSAWTPSPSGPGADEITGTATHHRQSSHVGTPATGAVHSSSAMTWTNLPACTIEYWIINSAATGTGTYKGGGPTTSTIDVPSGATVAAAIGAFTLTVGG